MKSGVRSLLSAILILPSWLAAGEEAADLPAGAASPAADPAARIRAELMQADRDFAAAVAAAPPAGRAAVWAGFFAEDGRQLLPGRVVQGRAAIGEMMDGAFTQPGHQLLWEPDLAEGSGDCGFTSGRYESHRRGSDGQEQIRTGRYVTFWRREDGGRWLVVVDTGVPDE